MIRLDRDSHEQVAADVDLGYAHGIAEDHVRRVGSLRLADSSARWRRAPMNDAQARRLRRLGVAVPERATKGQASDLITLAEARARLDRLSRRRAA